MITKQGFHVILNISIISSNLCCDSEFHPLRQRDIQFTKLKVTTPLERKRQISKLFTLHQEEVISSDLVLHIKFNGTVGGPKLRRKYVVIEQLTGMYGIWHQNGIHISF